MTYRNEFERTIVDEPPTRLVVDQLIVGSRRRRRHRRLVAGVAVVVGVIGVIALPVLGASGLGPWSGRATADPNVAQATTSPLADQLRAAVLAVAPGAQFPGPDPSGATPPTADPTSYADVTDPASVEQDIVVDGVAGRVNLFVARSIVEGDYRPFACLVDQVSGYSCQATTGPNGEPLMIETYAVGAGSSVLGYRVSVVRADGTLVDIAVNAPGGTLPLTVGQLTDIAFDPSLHA